MLRGITFKATPSSHKPFCACSDVRQPCRHLERPENENKPLNVERNGFIGSPWRRLDINLKSTRSPISTLSAEILILIGIYVATRTDRPFDRISCDILKLRLVSKLFDDVALETLRLSNFSAPTVQLMLRKSSYNMLLKISENPGLARIIGRIDLRTEVAYRPIVQGKPNCNYGIPSRNKFHEALRLVPGRAPDWAKQLRGVLSKFPNLTCLLLGDLGLVYYCPDMSHHWADQCFNNLASTLLEASTIETLQMNLKGGSCSLPRHLDTKHAQNLTEIMIQVHGSLFERRKCRPSRMRGFRDNNWSIFVGHATNLRKLLITCTADRRWWTGDDHRREREFLLGLQDMATSQLRVLALKGFCCPLLQIKHLTSRFGKLESLALVDMVLGSGKACDSHKAKFVDWPKLFDHLKMVNRRINVQLRCGTRVTEELWALNRKRHAQKVIEFKYEVDEDGKRSYIMRDEPSLKIDASREFVHELWK